MSRRLTASDRSALIRLASTMEKGSPERKAILSGLSKQARKPYPTRRGTKVKVMKPFKDLRSRYTIRPGAVGVVTRVEEVLGGADPAMLDYMGYNYDPATMDKVPGYKFKIEFADADVKEQDDLARSQQRAVERYGLDPNNLSTTITMTARIRDFMDGTLKR